jgi:hypothetical protein
MSDGKNLTGFNETKPASSSSWTGEQYAADPKSAFPAQDKSTQGPAGTTNKMVHSVEATRNFGAGN